MKQLIFALVVCAGPVSAGIPTYVTMTCPIGGEEFSVTETLSCTTLGRTMSLKPITSCDFISRMPVCPGNGLPVYKEFSADELARISTMLDSDEYIALRDLPPLHRAYGLSVLLDENDGDLRFGLVLQAFWHETETFMVQPVMQDAFRSEIGAGIERVPSSDRPYYQAILGYADALIGRTEVARTRLSEITSGQDDPFLNAYVEQIINCLSDMGAPNCGPEAPFEP